MKRILYALILLSAAAPIFFLRCSVSTVDGGGTIETTNGVAGVIRNSDTTPASNTVVKLFPDDYDPVADTSLDGSFTDTTDTGGTYRFSRVAAGRYVVLARNLTLATSFIARDVTVSNDSLTRVPAGTLYRPGLIAADFSSGSPAAGGYVYIPGTDISSPIGSDGSALLTDVPPGTISTVILASGANEKRNVLRNKITVTADDTITIEHPLWKYSCRIGLTTTPAGADVAGDVYNFPVLIRLENGNFDFSQARVDGGDLVFSGSGGTSLPHEIERWDASAGRAEIWVKVDTVHGNDSTQSIGMYWGNPDAPPRPANGGVFDTADGYRGVWHMGGAANDSVHDATANRYHGYSPDTARPTAAEGVIGECCAFDGVDDYVTMPGTAEGGLNFPQYGYYTVSAWVFIDTFSTIPQLIVSKGYEQYFLWTANYPAGSPFWEFNEFNESTNWESSRSPAAGGQWVFLAGVRQGEQQFLFCNGVLVDSVKDVWPYGIAKDTLNDLSIGSFLEGIYDPSYEGYCFFRGSIDEVRIISAAQSPDWARLCYMNQRSDDRLVVFK